MKRATLHVLRNETSHRNRCDVRLYVETPEGKPRRIVLLENVPTYYAECALRGARNALIAVGFDVAENP